MADVWRGAGLAVWPSYPVKSILQGKGLPSSSAAPTTAVTLAAYEQTLPQGGGQAPPAPGPGPGPPPAGSAQNIAKMLLSRFGWTPAQMPPLVSLWTQESGWRTDARNPSSGALGIAQALGHGTADTAGSLGNEYGPDKGNWFGMTKTEMQAANSGSALQQIRWGLGYIKARYGTPAAAWAHEQRFNWY